MLVYKNEKFLMVGLINRLTIVSALRLGLDILAALAESFLISSATVLLVSTWEAASYAIYYELEKAANLL